MEQIGKVIRINDKTAEIQIQRATACGGECGKCSGCTPTAITVSAKNEIHAEVGQMVKLNSSTKSILSAAFMVYIVPIIILIASYIIAYSYVVKNNLSIDAQLVGIIAGLSSLIISFSVLHAIDKKVQKNNKLELRIIRIIH